MKMTIIKCIVKKYTFKQGQCCNCLGIIFILYLKYYKQNALIKRNIIQTHFWIDTFSKLSFAQKKLVPDKIMAEWSVLKIGQGTKKMPTA